MRCTFLVLLIATASAATAQVNTERMRRLLTDDGVMASVDAASDATVRATTTCSWWRTSQAPTATTTASRIAAAATRSGRARSRCRPRRNRFVRRAITGCPVRTRRRSSANSRIEA